MCIIWYIHEIYVQGVLVAMYACLCGCVGVLVFGCVGVCGCVCGYGCVGTPPVITNFGMPGLNESRRPPSAKHSLLQHDILVFGPHDK